MEIKFIPYSGDLMGLPVNENHLIFKWIEPDCDILFAVSQQGKALVGHLASNKKGLRKLKQALNEFCEFCFYLFDVKMLIITTLKRSISRLARQCGFVKEHTYKDYQIYVRRRL